MKKQRTLSKLANYMLFGTNQNRFEKGAKHPIDGKLKKSWMSESKRRSVLKSTLLCFGAGSFTPGGFGYAPIPRKI